jgi:hypothetical protein
VTALTLSGRYVTVRRGVVQPDLCFNLAELQVFGLPPTPVASRGAACSMSSTPADGSAPCALALDGNPATFASNAADSIAAYPFGWLTVDLGVATAIASITLIAQAPNSSATLNRFSIQVGDSPTPFGTNVQMRNAPCNQTFLPASLAELPSNTSTVRCVPNDGLSFPRADALMTGRFVSLQLAAGTPAGSFFAVRQNFVSPESFTFIESATILAIVVLGGMGSQIGVALAAVAMIGGTEILRELDVLKQIFGEGFDPAQYRMLIFGLAMVVMMIWKPRGLISSRTPSIFLKTKRAVAGALVREGQG